MMSTFEDFMGMGYVRHEPPLGGANRFCQKKIVDPDNERTVCYFIDLFEFGYKQHRRDLPLSQAARYCKQTNTSFYPYVQII